MSSVKQITLRNPSPLLTKRLRVLSEVRQESLNATILHLLEQSVGIDERRIRLERYVTWNEQDRSDFDDALSQQRIVDERDWS